MTADSPVGFPRYVTPSPGAVTRPSELVWRPGTSCERRFVFYDQIQIGRDDEGTEPVPGRLSIADATISRRHCTVRQMPDGRCFARDMSRNGTRLDGRRMVPNVEVEVRPGQVLAVGSQVEFVLQASQAPESASDSMTDQRTIGVPGCSIATVLVGDIREYTTLVRRAPSVELQQSVNRVFEILSAAVAECQGTVKEYQGDAILAFWEGDITGKQAAAGCRAALALDRVARRIAADPSVWQLSDFPLQVDWALATGPVLLDSFGGIRPTGLSLIGEPVVLAFRLEKYATDETGRILVCRITRNMAGQGFVFRDLGEMQAKGFDKPDRVYALEGERPGPDETRAGGRS